MQFTNKNEMSKLYQDDKKIYLSIIQLLRLNKLHILKLIKVVGFVCHKMNSFDWTIYLPLYY